MKSISLLLAAAMLVSSTVASAQSISEVAPVSTDATQAQIIVDLKMEMKPHCRSWLKAHPGTLKEARHAYFERSMQAVLASGLAMAQYGPMGYEMVNNTVAPSSDDSRAFNATVTCHKLLDRPAA